VLIVDTLYTFLLLYTNNISVHAIYYKLGLILKQWKMSGTEPRHFHMVNALLLSYTPLTVETEGTTVQYSDIVWGAHETS
jgi:hypothetical protein